MPPIQPNSAVPRIELNRNGTVNLVVNVYGFAPGTPIEISGQLTQENGTVATFHIVKEMPPSGPVLVAGLEVVPPNSFAPGFPITIVARAAQVWITTLGEDTDPGTFVSHVDSAQLRAAWKENSAQWAVSWAGQKSPAAWQSQPVQQSSPPTTLIHHGTWWDRAKRASLDTVMGGRFTRLFPDLPAAIFARADLERLAEEMIAPEKPVSTAGPDPEENPGVPAAYTYLGQFVDHDLTFDPASNLRESLTQAQLQALVDFRTPRFDLDNLYGRGPDDQPYMYEEDGIYMLLGEPMSGNPFDPGAVQLPRGPNGRALIGDPRDDENRIVAQLHAIFLRFHNKVADKMGGKKYASFAEVRQQVRWHYQWVLVNDFLPRVLEKQTYQSVFPDPYGHVRTIPRLRENGLQLMPVEFSVAAYRFGHSMVRPHYALNPTIERPILSDAPGDDADLGGFRPIPANWAIDWPFFIDLDHGAGPVAGSPRSRRVGGKPQLSYKIDTSLANPLGELPARIATNPSSLALRNLERGMTFQLPTGQDVAAALGIPVIPDEKLMIGKATADGPQNPITKVVPAMAGNAPLWAYILSEAQVTSWENPHPGLAQNDIPIRLGPVGGRLVAEVFASLLRGDPTSYLHAKPRFVPITSFTRDGTFGLAELINVALRRTL